MLPEHSDEQIDRFDAVHGIGSYDCAKAAASRVLRVSRAIDLERLGAARADRTEKHPVTGIKRPGAPLDQSYPLHLRRITPVVTE